MINGNIPVKTYNKAAIIMGRKVYHEKLLCCNKIAE